jgi:hypothetical protein
VFTIELTRGLSSREPVETIGRRKCDTISIEFAAAEALHWLLTIQKNVPTWGATHYRVMKHGEAIIGGGTTTAAGSQLECKFPRRWARASRPSSVALMSRGLRPHDLRSG